MEKGFVNGKEISTRVRRSKTKTNKPGDKSEKIKRKEEEVVEGTANDNSIESTAVKKESMERTAAAGDEETGKAVKLKGLDRLINFKKKGMDQNKKARGGIQDLADDSACVDDPYMYNEKLRGKTSILSLDLAALNGIVRTPNETKQSPAISPKKEKKNENVSIKSSKWRRKNIGTQEKTTTSQYGTIIEKKGKKNDRISSWRKIRKKDIRSQEKTTSQYITIEKKDKRTSKFNSLPVRKKKTLGAQEKTQRSLSSEEFSRKGKKKGQDMERKCDAQKGILKDGEMAAATGRKNLNDVKTPVENDRENYGKYIKIDDVVKKDVGRNEDVQQRNENKHRKADQIIESVRFETP